MTHQLPVITKQQHTILTLLFTYRFLHISHLQSFLHHKDKRRIQYWLNDLIQKEYITQIYESYTFKAAAIPATYYLGSNGIRSLRSDNTYPITELRNRYRESTRTPAFIDRCILMADCYTALQLKSNAEHAYDWLLPPDYLVNDSVDEGSALSELRPHLFLSKKEAHRETRYVVEEIPATWPRPRLRGRVTQYLDYLLEADSQNDESIQHIALFIAPTLADLIYIKRRVRTHLDEMSDRERATTIFRVATRDSVKQQGITGRIWEPID